VESAGLHGLSRISPRGGEGNTARTRTPQVTAFGSMLKAGVASLDVGAPVGRWNRMTLGDGSLLSGALPEHSVWMVPLGTSLLRPGPGSEQAPEPGRNGKTPRRPSPVGVPVVGDLPALGSSRAERRRAHHVRAAERRYE
jgi:hypothetical protein